MARSKISFLLEIFNLARNLEFFEIFGPSGQFTVYSLPEPVATWYRPFYTDYMTYLDIAGRDSVLAAQVASPGTQVTIQFIAMALEEAEAKAEAKDQTLNEFLENRTIADLVEQFTVCAPSMRIF